jgi:hypothetical protein
MASYCFIDWEDVLFRWAIFEDRAGIAMKGKGDVRCLKCLFVDRSRACCKTGIIMPGLM